MHILAFFDGVPRLTKVLVTPLLVMTVGFLNLLTGWETDFSLFYILPVAFSIWFLNVRAGAIACIACAAVWFWVDLVLVHTYTSEFTHYWNTFIRLSFFCLFAFLLNTLKNSHERSLSIRMAQNLVFI